MFKLDLTSVNVMIYVQDFMHTTIFFHSYILLIFIVVIITIFIVFFFPLCLLFLLKYYYYLNNFEEFLATYICINGKGLSSNVLSPIQIVEVLSISSPVVDNQITIHFLKKNLSILKHVSQVKKYCYGVYYPPSYLEFGTIKI